MAPILDVYLGSHNRTLYVDWIDQEQKNIELDHTHWNRHEDNRVTAPLLAHDCFRYNKPNRHTLVITHSIMTQLLIPVANATITRAATAQTHTEHDAIHTMQITAASWARSPLVSNCTSIQTEFWRPCFLDCSMPRCCFSVILCDQDYTNMLPPKPGTH
jgi:hypothetical protein